MKKYFLFFLIFILLSVIPLYSKIFKCIDKNGIINYSNLPCISHSLPKKNVPYSINIFAVRDKKNIANWIKNKKSFKSIKKFKRNIKYFLPVVLTYKSIPKKSKVNFKATYQFITPEQKIFNLPLFSFANRIDSRTPDTIVLSPVLYLTFDKYDKSGNYILQVKVINRLSKTVKTARFKIFLQ